MIYTLNNFLNYDYNVGSKRTAFRIEKIPYSIDAELACNVITS